MDDSRKGVALREGGRLADVALTMLKMLGLAQPVEMTGESLLRWRMKHIDSDLKSRPVQR